MISGSIVRLMPFLAFLAIAAPAAAGVSNEEKSPPNPEFADQKLGFAMLSAVIRADGSLARQVGIDTFKRLGAGVYEVVFERNVRDCTYSATVGSPDAGTPVFGVPVVPSRANIPEGVYIRIFDKDGATIDNSFHLIVFCGY